MKTRNGRNPPFAVNRNDSRSLLDQVADGLRAAIVGGYYSPGDMLPSSRELCPLLGVSRIVTSAALERLVAEGYILTRHGLKPVVRDQGAKQWRGHVLLVYENGDDNYLKTMLAGAMRDRLTDSGYLLSQASVGSGPDGALDFSHLDVAVSRSIDLALVMYYRPEIHSFLARRKIPFAVFGEKTTVPRGAVGAIHLDYNRAMPDFAAACVAAGVSEVMEVYWHRLMCDAATELDNVGIRVRKLKVAVDESEGRLIGVKRAGRIAFERLIEKETPTHNSQLTTHNSKLYFFADDYLASGALFALASAGLKAPDDVRLATFANKGLGPDYVRPLSRMEMDSKKAGETVADAIMHFLATGDFPDGIDVGPEWIAGDTL